MIDITHNKDIKKNKISLSELIDNKVINKAIGYDYNLVFIHYDLKQLDSSSYRELYINYP